MRRISVCPLGGRLKDSLRHRPPRAPQEAREAPQTAAEDAEERERVWERVRRMTWTLMRDPEVRRMLSEVTLRRDAFAAEDPSG